MDLNRRSYSGEPAPPGTSPPGTSPTGTSPPTFPNTPKPLASAKGVENAKKRLRAFSIQKKTTPISPIVPKPISTGTTTVLIGKLSGVKPTPKIEEDPLKKPPKPPKPGAARKFFQESYSDQQRRTLTEIEDMKRKMELVELGIPLGLICPSSRDEKAMPTKAMPPIKTFLGRRFRVYTATSESRPARKSHTRIRNAHHPAKVDELIREAKRARVEGREFKFDYQKILPDYDNPFQRKREDVEKEFKHLRRRSFSEIRNRKSDKHHFGRYNKEDRDIKKHKEEEKYKERDKDKSKDRSKPTKEGTSTEKETDVNLRDFLICDSWSENDDKSTCSPALRREDMVNVSVWKTPEKKDEAFKKEKEKGTDKIVINISKEPSQHFKECLTKKVEVVSEPVGDSPKGKPPAAEKLQPVIYCFKFEIDPNDDEILDIFDEESGLEKYSQPKQKTSSFYVPPGKASFESTSRDMSMDGMNDDTFLESVINEIRQDDNMCEETSEDKRLVEYDESPSKDDYDSPVPKEGKERIRASVTPEMDEKMIEQTRRKHEFDKKESLKQKNDDLDRKEPISVRSDCSDKIEQGSHSSQRSEYSDRKEQASMKSDYSDKKGQRSHSSQRTDYSDRKDSSSQRSYYSDRRDTSSHRSSYSDGRQSSESGYKTSDTNKSDSKYVDNFRLSVESVGEDRRMHRSTVESLETWSFVLKICQPLLFRHDKNKCFRETTILPKIWYTENPKVCTCVKDRVIVYEELEMLKMALVDRLYGCDQLTDTPSVNARAWYPRASACLAEGRVQPVAVDWEADDSQPVPRSPTPQREEEIMLDREYQRFMEAVWPDVAEAKASETPRSTTPVRLDARRKRKEEDAEKETEDKKTKKIKLSSEGWSQESDMEEEPEKTKKIKVKDKDKSRKRKRSSSTLSSVTDTDESSSKKRRMMKTKKARKKAKSKEAKRRRIGKKLLKKLKEKQKQKKKIEKDESEDLDIEEGTVKKKEVKKNKKKKQQKLKKKSQKRRRKASSTTDFTTTSSDSEGTRPGKSKKRKRTEGKKKKRDKRKKSSSESQSEDLFDVNILNNIKTERLTDDEKCQKMMEFSPRIQHKPREIINVKELQNDFVGNIIQIKQEAKDPIEEVPREEVKDPRASVKDPQKIEVAVEKKLLKEDMPTREREQAVPKLVDYDVTPQPVSPPVVGEMAEKVDIKDAQDTVLSAVPMRIVDDCYLSQSSSQESICSVKEAANSIISVLQETPTYEKDESHLRPSSQNSNYSFNDVIASQSALYHKSIETIVDSQDKYGEGYDQETGNYEIYEQLAMAYQSDVASLSSRRDAGGAAGGAGGVAPQRIETVVRARARGEIKCDWRADHTPAAPPANRPSRWGLKPSEVNIVLTGGEHDAPPSPSPSAAPSLQPVYRIQSLGKRTEAAADYDEAYMDMYGASDRLAYGDCFATDAGSVAHIVLPPAVTDIALVPMPSSPVAASDGRSTLDARIDLVLREAALSEMMAAAEAADEQKEFPEKGILITPVGGTSRGAKRVSFADGYQPGQDSDLEEPPIKKRRKTRRVAVAGVAGVRGRVGCAWPCPASHPDHVPLWDALPPPPPPPGDPPRSCRQALQRARSTEPGSILGGFMPPEPPPGLISF